MQASPGAALKIWAGRAYFATLAKGSEIFLLAQQQVSPWGNTVTLNSRSPPMKLSSKQPLPKTAPFLYKSMLLFVLLTCLWLITVRMFQIALPLLFPNKLIFASKITSCLVFKTDRLYEGFRDVGCKHEAIPVASSCNGRREAQEIAAIVAGVSPDIELSSVAGSKFGWRTDSVDSCVFKCRAGHFPKVGLSSACALTSSHRSRIVF